MPSLLKDRPTGRLGRLISALRPARAGPLPVQTGFPTSLADLFVKNHGRLRKPSSCASPTSRRKKRGAPPLPSPPASPAPFPPTSSPPSPPPPAAVSPTVQPRPDPPPDEPVCHTGGSPFGPGLGFLALVGVVISLSILVIWSRKVVAAVTVAAFSLFLLESIRSLSLFRRRPRAPATKEPDFGGRGYVSPIREVEAEPERPRRSCSDSDRWTDDVVSIPASTEDRIEERSEAGDESSSSSKARSKKRSWKKLIPRKLQKGGRVRKEGAEADSPSVSFRSESSEADATVGGNAKAPDSRRGSERHHQVDAEADAPANFSGPRHGDSPGMDGEARGNGGPIEIDASADLTPTGVDELGGGRSRVPFVAAVIVALVGLVAGRLPAVAFTVLLVSSLQRLSCRGHPST